MIQIDIKSIKIKAHRKGGEHYTITIPYQNWKKEKTAIFDTDEEVMLIRDFKKFKRSKSAESKKQLQRIALQIRYVVVKKNR